MSFSGDGIAYSLSVDPDCKTEIRKLTRKNRGLGVALNGKISEILENPCHYKPLGNVMHGARRVHICGCFVLVYEIVQPATVNLLSFTHHDEAY